LARASQAAHHAPVHPHRRYRSYFTSAVVAHVARVETNAEAPCARQPQKLAEVRAAQPVLERRASERSRDAGYMIVMRYRHRWVTTGVSQPRRASTWSCSGTTSGVATEQSQRTDARFMIEGMMSSVKASTLARVGIHTVAVGHEVLLATLFWGPKNASSNE
jgi:hypothetical protein